MGLYRLPSHNGGENSSARVLGQPYRERRFDGTCPSSASNDNGLEASVIVAVVGHEYVTSKTNSVEPVTTGGNVYRVSPLTESVQELD